MENISGILRYLLLICLIKATTAKIYGWDIPEHGNAAAPNPLPENTHSVTDILMVKAIPDGYPTSYTVLTYRVISQDGSTTAENFDFAFNYNKLQAKAHRTFDYEKQTEYVLLIRAYDNRFGRSGESSATVTVSIEDLNDNPPEFPKSPSYVSYIDEDAAEGTIITTVTATDKDGSIKNNQIVQYDIVGGDDHEHFSISTISGRITRSGQPWDKALKSTYFLQVEAIDNGYPRLTGTTTLVVHIGVPPEVNGEDRVSGNLTSLVVSFFFCVYQYI